MRIAKALALLAVLIAPLGCTTGVSHLGGQTELMDAEADVTYGQIPGYAAAIPDAPAAAVFATWNDPSDRFPEYLAQVVDPYNYPHLVWRAFYTVWAVPFNPLYHVTKTPTDDWDRYVEPVRETVAYDMNPAPHGGDGPRYWATRVDSFVNNMSHAWFSMKYYFFNTNSDLPPYDRYFPEQVQREKTMIHKSFDYHLFNFDWDDPYLD